MATFFLFHDPDTGETSQLNLWELDEDELYDIYDDCRDGLLAESSEVLASIAGLAAERGDGLDKRLAVRWASESRRVLREPVSDAEAIEAHRAAF